MNTSKLAQDLNLQIKGEISPLSSAARLSATYYNRVFSDLIVVKRGSPVNWVTNDG